MSKTIIQMLMNSKYKYYYLLFNIPAAILVVLIHVNTLNYTILSLVNYVAIVTSLILNLELQNYERGSDIYSYLTALKSENYLMVYRTASIFWVSSSLTVATSLIINLVYVQDIYIAQQAVYLIFILFANFFYIYFIQYLLINVQNQLFRDTAIVVITSVSMLSLMTRSLTTFMMYVTIIGLFLAVTCINRRISEELKREKANRIY